MKVLFIVNPVAGGGKAAEQVIPAVHEVFLESGVAYDIVKTKRGGDGTMLAKRASEAGYTTVVAAGGDGTINEVATGLVGTSAILGIIPVGSGNGLARGLRIPLNYWDACRLILRGESMTIDVGQVENRYFFATSGIGFDAHVGKIYNEQPGHSRGILPYFQFAVTEFFNYEPREVLLTFQGQTSRHIPFVLTVANVEQYGGGAIIAPDAIPNDGLFDVVIIPQSHPLQILAHLPKLFSGTVNSFPHFESHKTNALTIQRSAPGPIHVDGEAFMAGETLEYTLLPQALHVQVHKKVLEWVPYGGKRRAVLPPCDHEVVLTTIEHLARLKDEGILTEQEFQTQKQKLLERL
jgi:YegS/Rv2252/BmrU family lipid kinase